MITSSEITVSRSLRYATREATVVTKRILIALHGYGQLSRYFIRKFDEIDPEFTTVIVPEGMHRFYLNGHSGRVGASWMTKEARELDIRENSIALSLLLDHVIALYGTIQIVVLGFSQGGATAARWMAMETKRVDLFISWASVFPPDLHMPDAPVDLASRNIFVVGNQDEFFDPAAVEQRKRIIPDWIRNTPI